VNLPLKPIAAILGAGLALVAAMPLGMLWMLRHPPEVGGHVTPDDHGLNFTHERITTSDGVELDAWIVPAQNDTRSAIVIGHGYPASKGDVLPSTAFLADDHHLVYLDHRGLGQSEGDTTLGVDELLDVQAGIERAASIDNVTSVGLLGFSMGGAAAIQAAHDERVDAVVTQAAYADLESLPPTVFGGFGPLAKPMGGLLLAYGSLVGVDAENARPVDPIRDLDKPVLLVHGNGDETIPVDHAHRLNEAAPSSELWIVDANRHGAAHLDPDYERRVSQFFGDHLEAAPG
jgi:pimeloyl-ACP methyl ester carboxylesterase